MCWSAAAAGDGLPPDTASFQLQTLPTGATEWVSIAETPDSKFTLRGLAPGTPYVLRVRAREIAEAEAV